MPTYQAFAATDLLDQLPRARLTLAEPVRRELRCRLRDELLAVAAFHTLLDAQVLVKDRRIEDNTLRPPSALG